jgi:hypothetical protein
MARIPEPQAGMVIRYEYLWARQHEQGMAYGEKTRPCAILAVVNDKDDTTVYVSPITHTAPFHPEESILLTQETKRRLGLDTQNSWLMVNEVNKFTWPGDDLRRVPHVQPASYTYGMLPETVLLEARSKLKEFNQRRQMHLVPRDAAAQHRTFNRAAG